MLLLRKGRPKAQRVPLGAAGTAWIEVRPATRFEMEEAGAQVARRLAGLIAGSEAAVALAGILGDEFDVDGLDQPNKLAAASSRLTDIYLTLACQSGWYGVGSEETGEALGEPDAASIAQLLNDPVTRQKVMAVINSSVHREVTEGNGLPASPTGGAGNQPTAANAARPASAAP